MEPKNNFLNAQPSISTDNEAVRANDLSTTDDELETSPNDADDKVPTDKDAFVNSVNDAAEPETSDAGLDEES